MFSHQVRCDLGKNNSTHSKNKLCRPFLVVFLLRCEVVCVCVCMCMHTLVCVRKDNQERLQKKWTILFVYTAEQWRLSSVVTLPSVLRLARSHLSFTKACSFFLVFELICRDSVRPRGPSSRTCVLSEVKEGRVETGECPGAVLAPYSRMGTWCLVSAMS